MAKARTIPGLTRDLQFREAAARTVEVRTSELFAFAGDVLDTEDIEQVHDMRVASRRLRAALELYAPCFPKRQYRQNLSEVKTLADALGARRDPDVAIDGFRRFAGAAEDEDRAGVEVLIDEFRREQQDGNGRLEAELERVRGAKLEIRLLAMAAEARLS